MIDKIYWCSISDLAYSREWAIKKQILETNKKFTAWRMKDRLFIKCKNEPGRSGMYGVDWRL